MDLLVNKEAKKFLIILVITLIVGVFITAIITYSSAIQLKNEMIKHDYELCGYLINKYPELSDEIPGVFTKEKSTVYLEVGEKLLKQTGYKNSLKLYFIPRVNNFFKTNLVVNIALFSIFSLIILVISYIFLKKHYQKIDQYNNHIQEIMNGKISLRLDDNGEGSIYKLATSINTLKSSLHAHIEKEKHNRIFLKDTLTNISHQLKTPLAALNMYTEIMTDENTDNKVINKFLLKSENELVRMHTLITNLLKLAKLDAGIIVLHKSTYSLNDIINKVLESFETRIIKEQKTFEVLGNKDILYSCDKDWIFEALSNLLKNAVEHTAAGNHIKILLDETPLLIKITIEDNGDGIHPDDLKFVFKRFYRSKFSQNKQGSGIGLTLAKTIIEMHGGFISVESNSNEGSKFIVHLPSLQNSKV